VTGIIKAGQIVLSVDRVALGAQPAVTDLRSPVTELAPISPLHDEGDTGNASAPERDRLLARIAELEAATSGHEAELAQHARAAFERGIEDGVRQAVHAETERLALLKDGIDAALDAFIARLASLDGLAAEVALVGLERVLGDPTRHAELVVETVRHRLTSIAQGSLVGIRLSADDFGDPALLDAVRRTLDTAPSVSLVADPQLPAGACVIELTLGKLDAGIPRQLASVAATIREASRHA
jgi:flagellar assembly protein FliH